MSRFLLSLESLLLLLVSDAEVACSSGELSLRQDSLGPDFGTRNVPDVSASFSSCTMAPINTRAGISDSNFHLTH